MDLSTEALELRIGRLRELSTHLTFRISRMSKLLEVEGSARLAGSGVNLTGYRIMLVVSIFEEISVSDLAKVMVIDRAQISRAANELIERGLLESRSDRRSKRKKLLALTEEGHSRFVDIRNSFDQREKAITALLSEDELRGLWASTEKISRHLEDA